MIDTISKHVASRLRGKRGVNAPEQPDGMRNLVFSCDGRCGFGFGCGLHHDQLFTQLLQRDAMLRQAACRKVPAVIEAFQMPRAGIDREAVGTESLRRHMKAVRVGGQPGERGFVVMFGLDTPE